MKDLEQTILIGRILKATEKYNGQHYDQVLANFAHDAIEYGMSEELAIEIAAALYINYKVNHDYMHSMLASFAQMCIEDGDDDEDDC